MLIINYRANKSIKSPKKRREKWNKNEAHFCTFVRVDGESKTRMIISHRKRKKRREKFGFFFLSDFVVKWRESVAYAHNFRKGEGLSWRITQIADYHHRPVRELAWREENLLVFRCVWELAGLLWERPMRIFKKILKKNIFISCFYKMYLL